MSFPSHPTLNALLNAASAILLITAYTFIKRKRIDAHRNTMLAATAVSLLFLSSYLIYHYRSGSTPFPGDGGIRAVYFSILISHTILAVANVPLVIITLTRGLKRRIEEHRKIARWTLPIWLYISVTGVGIYMMLYLFQY